MKKMITNFIKRYPMLYDLLNRWRKADGPLEHWLDSLSQYGPLRFIQVGASDGLRWDPLRKHIIKNRWEGVLIEPLPQVFELLKSNYKYLSTRQNLTFVNAAISNEARRANLTFWACSQEFLKDLNIDQALYWLRMSSLQRECIEDKLRVIAKHPAPEEAVESVNAPVVTLSKIIKTHFYGNSPDLLFIDAEGHDDAVIYGHDFIAGKPRWIVYESHNLQPERRDSLCSFLINQGYSLQKIEGDTIATLKVL